MGSFPQWTLQYDTYFNDDETECIVIDRFRDSDASSSTVRTSLT